MASILILRTSYEGGTGSAFDTYSRKALACKPGIETHSFIISCGGAELDFALASERNF